MKKHLLIVGVIILFVGVAVKPSIATVQIENEIQQDFDKLSIITGWYEQAQLLASNGTNGDAFGVSVTLDGDTAFIGASGNDSVGESSGAVYVFKYDGILWNEEIKLIASDATNFSSFGCSVSLDEDRVLIGARGANGNENDSGSAYVFKRNGTNWEEEVKLIASDGAYRDQFGYSVSLEGNIALIGAMYDDDNGDASGSAYVFKYDGNTWKEEAKLLPSDEETEDNFGCFVSLDGDTALIGARNDDDNGNASGSAYVFKRNGTNWDEEAKLIASDGGEGHWFGDSVSLDGDTALIGARGDDDNGGASGSAYVFKRNGTNWDEEAKLIASDGEEMAYFGISVSIDADTALIGAFGDNGFIGSAYMFKRNGSSWNEHVKFRAAYEGNCDWFGYSVTLDGDTPLIGAMRYEDGGGVNQIGAAYIFKKGHGPNMDCYGSLSWSNVSPRDTLEGNFTIENIGETGSNLEWEIAEYPDWGDWTFNPKSGVGLIPEVGPVIVNVTVIAPDDENKEFNGSLKVVNKHNSSDYCYIPVYLKTPKDTSFSFNLLNWFLERYPLLNLLLQRLRI